MHGAGQLACLFGGHGFPAALYSTWNCFNIFLVAAAAYLPDKLAVGCTCPAHISLMPYYTKLWHVVLDPMGDVFLLVAGSWHVRGVGGGGVLGGRV